MNLQQFRDNFDDIDLYYDAVQNTVGELDYLVSQLYTDTQSLTFAQRKAVLVEILNTMVFEPEKCEAVPITSDGESLHVSVNDVANAAYILAGGTIK